ncbi:MAG: hypothetical protein ACJA0Z_001414 [Halioglobus sp.]|jgi:hypothetical protein
MIELWSRSKAKWKSSKNPSYFSKARRQHDSSFKQCKKHRNTAPDFVTSSTGISVFGGSA